MSNDARNLSIFVGNDYEIGITDPATKRMVYYQYYELIDHFKNINIKRLILDNVGNIRPVPGKTESEFENDRLESMKSHVKKLEERLEYYKGLLIARLS